MKSYSKVVKSLNGTKAPPIGMLNDPETGLETCSTVEVARVLLDKHFPRSTDPNLNLNPNPNPNLEHSIKPKVIDFDAKELNFITKQKLKEAFSLFGSHKSAGPDNFKPIVLQKLPETLLNNLVIL
jgi:hypothetical protein